MKYKFEKIVIGIWIIIPKPALENAKVQHENDYNFDCNTTNCVHCFNSFCDCFLFTPFIGLEQSKGPITVTPSTTISKLSGMSTLKRSNIMAELANIAYEDTQKVAKKAKDLGFKLIQFYENKDAQCYRFVSDHDIVIACRGTEMVIGDIAADLRIRRVIPLDGSNIPGLVHRGFRGQAYRLWDAVHDDILTETDRGVHKLWFTGHSLGAAIATLLATYSQQTDDSLNVSGLVTFGSPRVGNWTFANFANKAVPKHMRWVNNDDAVTKVPLNLLGHYSHCGHLMYLKEDGTFLNDVSWLKIFADRALGRLYHIFCCRNLGFSDARDHSIENYLERIKSLSGEDLYQNLM